MSAHSLEDIRYGLEDGYLAEYEKIDEDASLKEGFQEWFAYLEVSGDNPWFNNEAYLNTLDKEAVKRFIEVTHEKYYRKSGRGVRENHSLRSLQTSRSFPINSAWILQMSGWM